jgi:CO dehydrogenase/acetyl-CoA synthase epsilon subunit
LRLCRAETCSGRTQRCRGGPILARLQSAKQPIVTVTQLVTRYGVRDLAAAFIARTNLPNASTTGSISMEKQVCDKFSRDEVTDEITRRCSTFHLNMRHFRQLTSSKLSPY